MNTKGNLNLIVGAPRSGTYLLLTRLSKQYDIAFPVETHFIPLFYRYLFLWGDLTQLKNRQKLLGAIYSFLEIWTARAEKDRDPAKIRQVSLLATKKDFELIASQANNYQELVHNMYRSFAKIKNSKNYGDKSAFFAHTPLDSIDSAAHPIKVVHIIRDGRDVSYSWRNIFTGPVTVVDSAIQWSKHVMNKEHWGNQHPSNYMKVQYEQLISNESATLESIAEFLDLTERTDKQNAQDLQAILAQGDMHKKINGPMIKANRNLWRQNMSASEIKTFEYFAGHALNEMGYQMYSNKSGLVEKLWYHQLYLLSKLRKLVSIRFWRLQIKNHLPILIWLTDLINLPLAKIINWRQFD